MGKWTKAQKKYANSAKGKEARKRYQESEKGKAARVRYMAKRKEKLTAEKQKISEEVAKPEITKEPAKEVLKSKK